MNNEPQERFGGWIHLIPKDEYVDAHVIPVQDIGYHYAHNCPCKPLYDDDMGTWEHNAYDGRDEVRH